MMPMHVKVLLLIPSWLEPLTYKVPDRLKDKLRPGSKVRVPLGSKRVTGFVHSEVPDDLAPLGCKEIIDWEEDDLSLTQELMELVDWLSEECLVPPGIILKAVYPSYLNQKDLVELFFKKESSEPQDGQNLARSFQYRVTKDVSPQIISSLGRKAPLQQRVLETALDRGGVLEEREVLSLGGKRALKGLLEKGYLVREVQPLRPYENPLLTREQARTLEKIVRGLEQKEHQAFLIFGVTGSGKTEVYVRAVERARELGLQSLILVPEIGLTEQIINYFATRIGRGVSVLHSGMSQSERALEWLKVKRGQADVVIGARSAVFAPFKRLGLIVIDEEQEPSFRQEEMPRYHVRDVARWRAQKHGAVVVLGSATPALETYHAAVKGELILLNMSERIGGYQNKIIKTIDMRQEYSRGLVGTISEPLAKELEDCLKKGQQAIILLNRRGYANVVLCWDCGYVFTCGCCDVGLNYHRDKDQLLCHYCGYAARLERVCPRCGGKKIHLAGAGTQRIEEELAVLFPCARIARMDTDAVRKKNGPKKLLEDIKNKRVDVVVGTQMIAKGLDFPHVSLVGVLNIDGLLGLPDFRARERAFHLLVQVAGRAGRGGVPGTVLIQTFNPEDPLFDLVRNEDYLEFYRGEAAFRAYFRYPPFSNLVKIVFSGAEEEVVKEEALFYRYLVDEITGEQKVDIEVLGPAPCVIKKLKGRFRYQMLLKGQELESLRDVSRYIISKKPTGGVKIDVDVNPLVMI